jgi:hypothetical protein
MRKFVCCAFALVLMAGATTLVAEPQEMTLEQLAQQIFAPAAGCEAALPAVGGEALRLVSECGESDCFDVSDCIWQCPNGNNPACVDGVCQYDYSPPPPPSGGRCDEADCVFNSDCLGACTTSNPTCVNSLCVP